MIDLDEVLSAHARNRIPASQPPLDSLRRRAARKRQAAATSVLAVAVLVAGVSLGVMGLAGGEDTARSAAGALTPREPSSPDVGVLAGRVQEVPEPEQRRVTLRFTDATGSRSVTVATRQGGTWQVELPAGTWRISVVEGGSVCQGTAKVTAGAWQRHDIAWPCADPDAGIDLSGLMDSGTLGRTFGGEWLEDDASTDPGLPGVCPGADSPLQTVQRTFTSPATGARVALRVQRFRDMMSARNAHRRILEQLGTCPPDGQAVEPDVEGTTAELTYGRTRRPGQPDAWFTVFTSTYTVVSAALVVPDSTDEQERLAVRVLSQAAGAPVEVATD